MGKKTTILGCWCAFCCIVYFGLYRGFIYPLFGTTGDEAFIAFCALALFLGQNGDHKKLLNFALSGICGGIWGWIFVMGVGLLLPIFNFSFVPAALIDIFVFTALAIIVHTFILQKTLVNNMPFVFLGVATTFSGTAASGFLGIVHISFLLICGMLIGTATNALAPKIFGPPPTE
ncbi:MAG: DUF1097 domain-containing protein [Firmicutes bacterium]|nr:DUF1097 domain-containing protein [Bacillota bacterium]